MPRKKQEKKRRETRVEKKNKEIVEHLKQDAERRGATDHSPKDHFAALLRNEMTGELLASTIHKNIVHRNGSYDEKYDYIPEKLIDILSELGGKNVSIWFSGSLDDRHDLWKEVIKTFEKVTQLFDNLDPIGLEILEDAIGKVNLSLFDLREIQRRTDYHLKKRKLVKKYINYYEDKIPARPNFKIIQICVIGTNVKVWGNEDVPKREMAFRIKQYKSWFMIQYFRFCAPLDKKKRHKKLKDLLADTNCRTREPYQQVQMPHGGGFRDNFIEFLPRFLNTVIRNGGRKSMCTHLLSVLPKGVRLPWEVPKSERKAEPHSPENYMQLWYSLEIGLENLSDYEVD